MWVCPDPRDQIATREDPAFVKLRGEIARLVRAAALGDERTARNSL